MGHSVVKRGWEIPKLNGHGNNGTSSLMRYFPLPCLISIELSTPNWSGRHLGLDSVKNNLYCLDVVLFEHVQTLVLYLSFLHVTIISCIPWELIRTYQNYMI